MQTIPRTMKKLTIPGLEDLALFGLFLYTSKSVDLSISSFLFKNIYLFLFYVMFVCLHMCVCECMFSPCVCLVTLEARKGYWIPWIWSYWWVLGTKHWSFAGRVSACNCQAISPAPVFLTLWYRCVCGELLQIGLWTGLYFKETLVT